MENINNKVWVKITFKSFKHSLPNEIYNILISKTINDVVYNSINEYLDDILFINIQNTVETNMRMDRHKTKYLNYEKY